MSSAVPADPKSLGEPADTDQASRAYHLLRALILDCSLMPGEQVSVLQLMRSLEVGRTPLREAIRMLQQEGLMDSRKHHRPRVAPFDPAALDALYAVRIMSDALALQLTVHNLTSDDLLELEETSLLSAAALATGDMDAYAVPHNRFHGLLAAYSGDALKKHLQQASDGAERFRRMYTRSVPNARTTAAEEHAAILAAVRARDPQAGVERLATHLARTALQVMLHFAPEYEPRATRQALRLVTGQGLAVVTERPAAASPVRRSTRND